jgi:hypothetical protein
VARKKWCGLGAQNVAARERSKIQPETIRPALVAAATVKLKPAKPLSSFVSAMASTNGKRDGLDAVPFLPLGSKHVRLAAGVGV